MTKAVVLPHPGAPLELCDVSLADPRTDEIRVRIAAAGICHSDLHVAERGLPTLDGPIVLGHEASGEVVQVGDGVTTLEVGDHVVLSVVPQCGTCEDCVSGYPTLCTGGVGFRPNSDGSSRLTLDGRKLGQLSGIGGWSEEVVVSQVSAVKIDPSMPLVQAALIGCGVVTGFGAVKNVAGLKPGQTMAVLGCGGLGLNAIQAGRLAGAARIVAIDAQPAKLDLAAQFGATDLIDATAGDVIGQLAELTRGRGVDATFDFVVTRETSRQALSMARRGGVTVLTGFAAELLEFTVSDIIRAGRTVKGNFMGMGWFHEDFAHLVDAYLDGRLLLDQMISSRADIADFQRAVESSRSGSVARSVLIMP